jgi:hypothetical protein
MFPFFLTGVTLQVLSQNNRPSFSYAPSSPAPAIVSSPSTIAPPAPPVITSFSFPLPLSRVLFFSSRMTSSMTLFAARHMISRDVNGCRVFPNVSSDCHVTRSRVFLRHFLGLLLVFLLLVPGHALTFSPAINCPHPSKGKSCMASARPSSVFPLYQSPLPKPYGKGLTPFLPPAILPSLQSLHPSFLFSFLSSLPPPIHPSFQLSFLKACPSPMLPSHLIPVMIFII